MVNHTNHVLAYHPSKILWMLWDTFEGYFTLSYDDSKYHYLVVSGFFMNGQTTAHKLYTSQVPLNSAQVVKGCNCCREKRFGYDKFGNVDCKT